MTVDEARKSGSLKAIDKTLIGEHIYDFYFNQAVTNDINTLLSDCVSREHWGAILEKYKNGVLDTDDLTDILLISHLQVGGNDLATPEEIVDRAFETKFKGKLGRKLIANTIHALSDAKLLKAPEQAVLALVNQTLAKSDQRAIPENQLALTEHKEAAHQIQAVSEKAFDEFTASLNITDQVRDITYDDFLKALADESNPYFDFAVQMCFDMGWEKPTRTTNEPKCLALYFFELDKAWTDTADHNVKQADRHVARWLLRDVKVGEIEKVQRVKDALVAKFRARLEDKIAFMQVLWQRGMG